jgi:hypothetical protein
VGKILKALLPHEQRILTPSLEQPTSTKISTLVSIQAPVSSNYSSVKTYYFHIFYSFTVHFD